MKPKSIYLRTKRIVCFFVFFLLASIMLLSAQNQNVSTKKSYSGIYPHLAHYNQEGECGTGAVVPWAGRLWVITYGQHFPNGSSDKLYEITSELTRIIRDESIGGTPANRMIHKESNQLFIGPYAIDNRGKVRTIPYSIMPGRHTGNARHLFDPQHKIYYGTMEEGFYEVDVNTLDVKELYPDANALRKAGQLPQHGDLLPGSHGKGLYSGQGVMVYSNNGEATKEALHKFDVESGALLEWNGKDWKLVRRNQFTEVTGPGGIYGNENSETDPIWAVGWDHKSLLLAVRESQKGWSFYRLPKASYAYDGAHGYNTEWPRIRDIGKEHAPDYLMTMHGMFWRFPQTFSSVNTGGIQPRSAYLKVIGDFTRWHDKLVFGTDDSAKKEFLNTRKAKGGIVGPGQSNSNLWFTDFQTPDNLGPTTAGGHVWLNEEVKKGEVSDAFLCNGWDHTCAWVRNDGNKEVTYLFEADMKGNNDWTIFKSLKVAPKQSLFLPFDDAEKVQWIRVSVNETTSTSVAFVHTAKDIRKTGTDKIFSGLVLAESGESYAKGLLYSLGDDRRTLGICATLASGDTAYYEIDGELNFEKKNDRETAEFIRSKVAIPKEVVSVEHHSIKVTDDRGRIWRLPKSTSTQLDKITIDGSLRICREVATERDLFNCHGTFYELPAENADGFAKIRPISSHLYKIHDYASYRGMLVMTGIDSKTQDNEHILRSSDGKMAVWLGSIDDLWKLGKPVGIGGPWSNTAVRPGELSDPYLIGYYDQRLLSLSHKADKEVEFVVEVDPTGDGSWVEYKRFSVKRDEDFKHRFPDAFQARWIRFKADTATTATALLTYN